MILKIIIIKKNLQLKLLSPLLGLVTHFARLQGFAPLKKTTRPVPVGMANKLS